MPQWFTVILLVPQILSPGKREPYICHAMVSFNPDNPAGAAVRHARECAMGAYSAENDGISLESFEVFVVFPGKLFPQPY